MAAELAFVKLISSDATLSTSLGSGTNSRCVVGQLPQTMVLPAVNIVRESTKPSDQKTGTSPLDEESITVTIRDLSYTKVLDLADQVRNLLDGLTNQSVVVNGLTGNRTINIESAWFSGEAYDNYEHQDRIIEVHEQKYTVRIKR